MKSCFVIRPIKAPVWSHQLRRWRFFLYGLTDKARRTFTHPGVFRDTHKITLASSLVLRHFTWDRTPAKCYRGKTRWACFSWEKTLGEMPELSVFLLHSLERHSQVVKMRLDDFAAVLSSWHGTGDKSVGSYPKSPDVPLKISICTLFYT